MTMFPNRPRLEFLVVVHRDGTKEMAKYPMDVAPGDQIVLCKEEKGLEVSHKCSLNGYSVGGPILINKE